MKYKGGRELTRYNKEKREGSNDGFWEVRGKIK